MCVSMAGTGIFLSSDSRAYGTEFDTKTAVTAQTITVSRSLQSSRTDTGSWDLGDTQLDSTAMSKSKADNPQVAALMDRDADSIPSDFNPNHATGDSGNAYSFSQCTWWAYKRRQQLGLPVGSHFGNGRQWADSAKALGYWVDNTPRVGDIMVFKAGQENASILYGHVAIVEQVNEDGSIVTSECGAICNGKPYSRTFTNTSDFQYIHY